jgi:hypothetical protein
MRTEKKYDLPKNWRANNNKTNETTVAVYLEKNNYRIRFIPTGVSFESDTSPGMQPVYVRMFSEFLLALGYYKVLSMLSRKSIEQIISDSHCEAPPRHCERCERRRKIIYFV